MLRKITVVAALLSFPTLVHAQSADLEEIRDCQDKAATLSGFLRYLSEKQDIEFPDKTLDSVDARSLELSQVSANIRLEELAQDIFSKSIAQLTVEETDAVTRLYKAEVESNSKVWAEDYADKLRQLQIEFLTSDENKTFDLAIEDYNTCYADLLDDSQ